MSSRENTSVKKDFSDKENEVEFAIGRSGPSANMANSASGATAGDIESDSEDDLMNIPCNQEGWKHWLGYSPEPGQSSAGINESGRQEEFALSPLSILEGDDVKVGGIEEDRALGFGAAGACQASNTSPVPCWFYEKEEEEKAEEEEDEETEGKEETAINEGEGAGGIIGESEKWPPNLARSSATSESGDRRQISSEQQQLHLSPLTMWQDDDGYWVYDEVNFPLFTKPPPQGFVFAPRGKAAVAAAAAAAARAAAEKASSSTSRVYVDPFMDILYHERHKHGPMEPQWLWEINAAKRLLRGIEDDKRKAEEKAKLDAERAARLDIARARREEWQREHPDFKKE